MAKSAPTDRKQAASDNGVLALAGAEILLKALEDEEVEVIFGYPGGAVLPIYDALFKNNKIRHRRIGQKLCKRLRVSHC